MLNILKRKRKSGQWMYDDYEKIKHHAFELLDVLHNFSNMICQHTLLNEEDIPITYTYSSIKHEIENIVKVCGETLHIPEFKL
jgi:trimethylamine:corrinoid methyltransferase-like protein